MVSQFCPMEIFRASLRICDCVTSGEQDTLAHHEHDKLGEPGPGSVEASS